MNLRKAGKTNIDAKTTWREKFIKFFENIPPEERYTNKTEWSEINNNVLTYFYGIGIYIDPHTEHQTYFYFKQTGLSPKDIRSMVRKAQRIYKATMKRQVQKAQTKLEELRKKYPYNTIGQ